MLACPLCGHTLEGGTRAVSCPACGFRVWREVAGRVLSDDLIEELLVRGHTGVISDFRGRSGRPFSAVLVLEGRRVRLQFPEKSQGETPAVARVRVESLRSGSVWVDLTGAFHRRFPVDFGLVPTHLAQCFGVIAAAKFLLHHLQTPSRVNLVVSAGDRRFVQYALRERTPADAEVRAAVEHMWGVLARFSRWEIRYEPGRERSLEGGPVSLRFPRGIFPWLRAEVLPRDDSLYVALPDCPAARAQFRASLRTARPEGDGFSLPLAAEPAVRAWLRAVAAPAGGPQAGSRCG